MKVDVVIDEKKKSHLLIEAFNDSNGKSKPRTPKLISFSLLIRQVILNDLGDWNDTEDKR